MAPLAPQVREAFSRAGCSVLCIAHRLETIMDYDKIMGLHQGQLVEFDSPARLLADPDSIFRRLVQSHSGSPEH